MTKYYQLLDATVNGYVKGFTGRKFNDWYSNQVTDHLSGGVSLEDVDVKLYLPIIKIIHAGWIVNPYNQMNSVDAKKIIESGSLTTGIHDAIW